MKLTTLLASTLLLFATLPAAAHALLEEASPRVGSIIAESPAELRLTFSEPIEPLFSHVQLSGQNGEVKLGAIKVDPTDRATLIAAVPETLDEGTYKVSWQVVSVDTHHTDGDFVFQIKP